MTNDHLICRKNKLLLDIFIYLFFTIEPLWPSGMFSTCKWYKAKINYYFFTQRAPLPRSSDIDFHDLCVSTSDWRHVIAFQIRPKSTPDIVNMFAKNTHTIEICLAPKWKKIENESYIKLNYVNECTITIKKIILESYCPHKKGRVKECRASERMSERMSERHTFLSKDNQMYFGVMWRQVICR